MSYKSGIYRPVALLMRTNDEQFVIQGIFSTEFNGARISPKCHYVLN